MSLPSSLGVDPNERTVLSAELPKCDPAPATTEHGYSRWAATYDSFPNPILAREERYVVPLLPPLEGKRALDLACGTGRWLQRLVAHGTRQAVGIDLSEAMLQVADSKAALRGRLLRADCRRVPFGPSVFDFGICSFALSHIRDLRNVARELAHVMRPKSDLFVADLHPEALAKGWQTGFRDAAGAVTIKVFSRPVEKVIQVFVAAGFECVTHVALCLGEPEKTLFRRANKLQEFMAASSLPAIYVARFKRTSAPGR